MTAFSVIMEHAIKLGGREGNPAARPRKLKTGEDSHRARNARLKEVSWLGLYTAPVPADQEAITGRTAAQLPALYQGHGLAATDDLGDREVPAAPRGRTGNRQATSKATSFATSTA
ncbi:hypothetical protein RQ831_08845 [Roseomonas gilardii]|uniref:Uncharacterized protein n=1 Tax=Roseomonas gilardii TaxID=257708 RepID=A0ABU3ME33_9PROT|nr:hypothetical protein [Roseomonas gilardii]MDT8331162.1 hypothetical protein [Roseomonas gilardii]